MRCVARRFAEQLQKVSQDDVDGYVSDNEGYGPPDIEGWCMCTVPECSQSLEVYATRLPKSVS